MIKKRILAYLIDYVIMMLYVLLLFGIIMMVYKLSNTPLVSLHPLKGNVVGFLTLTLPVFLYFYFSERSKYKGTIGKRSLKISVSSDNNKEVFFRNVLKFIPWEVAHFGIHWAVYYSDKGLDIPVWNWIVLILPQIMVLFYFISILLSKGYSSIYDKLAGTQIM